MAPSEKLCLRWDDFAANLSNALYDLKEDKDFTDLTLVCAGHQQVDVHKVVMASSSHFALSEPKTPPQLNCFAFLNKPSQKVNCLVNEIFSHLSCCHDSSLNRQQIETSQDW